MLAPVSDPKATRSVVSPGTGQLISSGSRRKSNPPPSAGEGVTLNLVNTSIAEFAKTILGDILGLMAQAADDALYIAWLTGEKEPAWSRTEMIGVLLHYGRRIAPGVAEALRFLADDRKG